VGCASASNNSRATANVVTEAIFKNVFPYKMSFKKKIFFLNGVCTHDVSNYDSYELLERWVSIRPMIGRLLRGEKRKSKHWVALSVGHLVGRTTRLVATVACAITVAHITNHDERDQGDHDDADHSAHNRTSDDRGVAASRLAARDGRWG